MHNRTVFNFGEFKSRKCSISFFRDYARKGQKNKKALKNQGFSRLYLFYSPYLVAEVGFERPTRKYTPLRSVSSFRFTKTLHSRSRLVRGGALPMLLIFSLVALPLSPTGRGRAPSPLPPRRFATAEVVEGQSTP